MTAQDGPIFREIADALRSAILSGELTPGTQLPSGGSEAAGQAGPGRLAAWTCGRRTGRGGPEVPPAAREQPGALPERSYMPPVGQLVGGARPGARDGSRES